MWDNIGQRLQKLAKVICWLGIIASVGTAILIWSNKSGYRDAFIIGLRYLIFGGLGSWVGSWVLYGLGLVVEKAEYGEVKSSSGEAAVEVVEEMENKEFEERKKREAEEKEVRDKEERWQERLKKIEEIRKRKAEGIFIKEDVFLNKISGMNSMMDIWRVWKDYDLQDKYPEVEKIINKYKEAERLYGELGNIETIKNEISDLINGL